MALSIQQSQANYLKTVHLSQIGEGKNAPGVKVDSLEKIVLEMAILFKILAEKNLDVAQAISSNQLAESIQFDAVNFFGGTYSVEIKVLDYYKFVNSGVRGVKDERGGKSPYSFKNLYVSKKMMNEIKKWLVREGKKVTAKPVTKQHAIRAEKKGVRFKEVDKTSALAYAVATNIKKKGLRPTNFWTKTGSQVEKEMLERAGNRFAIALIDELTNKK
jgi:hypothetical protein